MRKWTRYELDQFETVFDCCMSVALAYDKNAPIQLNQIRHGAPSAENPTAFELPKAHRDLIIKVKGLDVFANLFCPMNKQETMPRLIKYLCENHSANGYIQVKDFELYGCVWVDRTPKKHVEIVYKRST